VDFTTLNDSNIVILHFINSGTKDVILATVKIDGETQNKITVDSIHGLTFQPGDSGTITIEHEWITGNNYTVNMFTSDNMAGSYTDTA